MITLKELLQHYRKLRFAENKKSIENAKDVVKDYASNKKALNLEDWINYYTSTASRTGYKIYWNYIIAYGYSFSGKKSLIKKEWNGDYDAFWDYYGLIDLSY